MAIADTITSMQNHTSNAYTMIGYGTDLTGINKNLENLSTSIFNAFLEALRTPDTLFTNLPKKSGSGANITLNDTANAPMRIELGATELTQDGIPTPSSPQDIHTISGSNNVEVCGKNLFDIKEVLAKGTNVIDNGDGSYTFNTATAMYSTTTYLPFISNEQLTTSYKITNVTGRNFRMRWVYEDGYISDMSGSGSGTSEVLVSNTSAELSAHGRVVGLRANWTSTGTFTIKDFMVNVGTTALTYTPYTSQEADIDLDTLEYCKIGNYEDKFIRTIGKNLFDKDTATYKNGYIKNDSGVENATGGFGYLTSYVAVKPNTQYTIQGSLVDNTAAYRLYYYNSSKEWISRTSGLSITTLPYTFTTPNNCYFMQFHYQVSSYNPNSIMIEEGSTATEYEPYGSNEWYIKKNIGKIVLDGTETDWAWNGNQSMFIHVITENGVFPGPNTTPDMLSNYYEPHAFNQQYNGNVNYSISGGANAFDRISIRNIDITSVEALKTWLSTHNVIAYYQLLTPTYTQITGTLAEQLENVYKKMLSQKGQTNISQVNNDLAFNMNVSAIEE